MGYEAGNSKTLIAAGDRKALLVRKGVQTMRKIIKLTVFLLSGFGAAVFSNTAPAADFVIFGGSGGAGANSWGLTQFPTSLGGEAVVTN